MFSQRSYLFGLIGLLLLSGCASAPNDNVNLNTTIRGDEAYQAGDLPTAIRLYREEIKENPSRREPYLKLGYALLDGNYIHEAYKTFKEAQGRFGKCGSTYRGMGAAFLVMDRAEDALFQYEFALGLNPRDAKAINGQGLAFEMLGYTLQAQAAYLAAMELDPSNPNFENNYALSLTLSGHSDEGIRILERLVASPEATPRMRQNLALAYGLSGQMKKARLIGRMDLPDSVVLKNLRYMRAMKGITPHSSRYANALPTNLQQLPLMSARSWKESN